MAVTLILPLSAPLGVGRVIGVDEDAAGVRIRDLTTGVVYRMPGSVLAEFGELPWRGRVDACTVISTDQGTVTELVLDAIPAPGSQASSGSAVALEGAEQAAAAAKAQAAIWGGTDRPPVQEPERFW